jgi:hypothetical protein
MKVFFAQRGWIDGRGRPGRALEFLQSLWDGERDAYATHHQPEIRFFPAERPL